jgi:probable rRNA maturation factor
MAIHFIEEDRKVEGLKKAVSKNWLEKVILSEGKEAGIVNIVFCSDDYLVKVNEEFLHRDYYTDVISFDYSENGRTSGDILISVDRVRENAAELGISFLDEVKRIMVHGVLHLIGFNDDTDEKRRKMAAMEDLYIGMWQEGR